MKGSYELPCRDCGGETSARGIISLQQSTCTANIEFYCEACGLEFGMGMTCQECEDSQELTCKDWMYK